ncbi:MULTISPECIES: ABC1 kinase family protein [Marinobacter]|jgi:predicted unusual protein kinase regulating ubiquinone biosynthesis (AarF/ABC1/UbiB family)|uniref:ABC1 kinase family protein n=1 Tax=Marinobacter TaxID=2742 RepID=UPI000256EAB4|nr:MULTISPECIES: AarF/ABC1/UbiB kinase family protein [Marinobacter]MCG8521272.1 AarF/ABC1/UbiB kinase family protein [Pseudomonadales bacterium]MEC9385334.1 AarF/ABC1/UbiB kinase family protein [Pseudomonadota bacterium]MBN8240332.1 AarF/ABC1/UbiB kinase family protein [Marinobacter nauticus]MBY5963056.1 AarF/ABC1/UbiB kinase family protein [Marinobacter nauticus]MBY6103466.1 AarF/ABC1/UbiB kinase family protein [Marinobacter nauticus]
MSSSRPGKSVSRIKTGSFERRLSLTRAGLFAGTRMASHMATNWFSNKETREQRHRAMLSSQARFLVDELGRLKGSVVKIGQVMALYGEHFLPEEVTEALHTLEDQTTSLEWPAIERVLKAELGESRLSELDIDPEPIGAASLGQVHRAVRRSDGLELVLKVQYPGVADAVDSDLNAVAHLLKVARLVSFGPEFNDWLEEVREMMHREVDYRLEARTTEKFRQMLSHDPRFVVPRVLAEFSTDHIIASTYEHGHSVSSVAVRELPLERRSALGQAALELFFRELFEWGEIQTDPNFGNYRIRIAGEQGGDSETDRIVLLDFGAVQSYSSDFLKPVIQMIRASYEEDLEQVVEGGIKLRFMSRDWPAEVLDKFGKVCMSVLEPLAKDRSQWPDYAVNSHGQYRWKQSDLPSRVAKQAARSAISRYFRVPPKEFVFLNRKLIGVYTFIAVLHSEFNGEDLLRKYLYGSGAA